MTKYIAICLCLQVGLENWEVFWKRETIIINGQVLLNEN